MLICYLDDSGKDPQSHVTTLAGFVARASDWQAFEHEVEPIFERRGVSHLHAKELEDTDGEFKGWSVLKKQAFVAEFCQVLSRYSMLGVSMSCVKSTYDARAKQSTRKRTNRAYTFCFDAIVDWMLRDRRTGRAAWNDGLAFVLEAGHENNPEVEQSFQAIRKMHKLEEVLRSLSFVPKNNCRAIQAADLFAFYSRRDSAIFERAARDRKDPPEMETMLKIIVEKGEFRGFVASDFDAGVPLDLPSWRPPRSRKDDYR